VLALRKSPFNRWVRELASEGGKQLRWQKDAITILQIEAERFIVNTFVTANFNRMAITNSKRVGLKVSDLVTAIRGDTATRPMFDIYLARHLENIYQNDMRVTSTSKNERMIDSQIINLQERIANRKKLIESIASGDAGSLSKAKRYASTIKKREQQAVARTLIFHDDVVGRGGYDSPDGEDVQTQDEVVEGGDNEVEKTGEEVLVNKRKQKKPKKNNVSQPVLAADI